MAGFTYRLEREDGTPADPPTFETATPTWGIGDTRCGVEHFALFTFATTTRISHRC